MSITTTFACLHQTMRRRIDSGQVQGLYPWEMSLQALAEWHALRPQDGALQTVATCWLRRGWTWDHRLPYRHQPFAHHNGALARCLPAHDGIRRCFVQETAAMLAEQPRDGDGLIAHRHPRLPDDGRFPLLIDYMSGYASRLSEAAALGGSGTWWDVAAAQFIGYERALRHPASGLWHLGRGWGAAPQGLCHGAWSRGHGWLLRGLADCLRFMPVCHPAYDRLVAIARRAADALAVRQLPDGRWSTLLHRAPGVSEPETSGTGIIAYGLARLVSLGALGPTYRDMAEAAVRAACGQVDAVGRVHGACPGPGTLFPEGVSLYVGQALPVDEHHGRPAVLYACLGGLLLGLD